ncbi:methyltransferase domain-containing protein [Actibacterium sp. MT2.3-13A]|uniref:methyltransferase domain-containing protein n=1 Tax=Actibacterium sp. MT2.3-13A TaxID=2828332 RepID=UPI001BAC4CA4|nr:methyltransferase domain-containing protein [Actibacterium sp. MT2.3-13A]
MTQPPRLTDRTALTRNRARSRGDAMFLQHAARDEVQERLELVNRTFTAPAVVTGFPEIWAWPGAKIVDDDEVLDLEQGTHDLVIHALCLHWANDPVGQLVQCRRALRPDGLFLAVLFGGRTLHELRASLAEAETRLAGGLSPRVAPMGEIRDLGALLQRAGFALPVADAAPLTATYETALHLMHELRAMGEGNALAGRHRRFAPRALFAEAARVYAETYGTPDGRIPATFEMIVLTGWAPDDSQPKPLRPGSAAARLADALNTDEAPLPDPARPRRD